MGSDRSLEVTRSKVLFTSFLLEQNIALYAAYHGGPLFWRMFSDSDLAEKYGCALTNTGCIVGVLSSTVPAKKVQPMISSPFSVAAMTHT